MSLPILMQYIQQFCAEQFALYTYQNYIEVIILSFLVYKALRWLQSDHTKPMVLYVYLYAGIIIFSQLINALILFWVLIICTPIVAILCIIAHQKNIQKYFAWKNVHRFETSTLPDQHWMELLVRSVLLAAHHKKNIFCIIQRNDYILHYLEAPYKMDLPIQKNVLDLILASPLIENPSILLVTKVGTLQYVNSIWSNRLLEYMMMLGDHDSLKHCQEASDVLSRRTDAIIWHITPTSQECSIWYQDTHIKNMSVDQMLTILKKLVPESNINLKNSEGILYENKSYKNDSTSPHN
jgi:diadenylate cyclase